MCPTPASFSMVIVHTGEALTQIQQMSVVSTSGSGKACQAPSMAPSSSSHPSKVALSLKLWRHSARILAIRRELALRTELRLHLRPSYAPFLQYERRMAHLGTEFRF